MANELKVDASLSYSPAGISEAFSMSLSGDIVTGRRAKADQVVGTTEESFNMVDVSSCRFFSVRNKDENNYVQIGVVTGQYFARLKPGDFAIFPPDVNALFLKANTAACVVEILAVNA